MKRSGTLPLMLGLLATPAAAEWMRADTPHFTVYADGKEPALRKQAAELELFDAALRRFQGVPDTPDSRHNKVTVFVLPSVAAIQKLLGRGSVAGFYVPRVEGSVAFTPREDEDGGGINALSPRIVLFHEYAHHFLLGNVPLALPSWYSEGYAEVVSTAKINDKTITIGNAANHRAYGLFEGRGLSAPALFAPPAKLSAVEREAIYGRGWLLAHDVNFNKARRQQFLDYINALNRGTPSLQAATTAFGDLKLLDRALDAKMTKPLTGYVMQRAALAEPQVAIRPLTGGEKALIALRIESTHGVGSDQAKALLARARPLAAPWGKDAAAQGWLAEMA